MNSTMITVPDWARDFVKNYASTAYNLMNKLSSVPTVSIRNGTGAQLLPTVDFGGTGSITSVTVTNSGSHLHGSLYMMVSDPTGTGAILSPVLSDDGSSLVSITLVSGGSNYSSSPVILFTDMKTYMDGEDFYYWGNFSDFDAVSPAATAHVGSGKVISCAVINGGIGYVAPVKINFPGGSAAASALVVDGVIVSVTITNQGNEYTSVPTANIQSQGGGAQAVAVVTNGEISSIVLTFGGAGYIVTPGVYISGGNGTGAAAHATVANGVVTQVTMDSGGSGYTVGSSEVLPYPGTVVATQPAHETDGITALASRGSSGSATIAYGKTFAKGLIDGGKLSGLPTALLLDISTKTASSFLNITTAIGHKALYIGDPDSNYLAKQLTATTAATYIARLAAKMEADNYIRERASQDFAVGFGPVFAKEEVADAETLRKAGLYTRQYLQSTYEPLNRLFIETEECNVVRLEIFGNALRALTGSQQTTTSNASGASTLMQAVGCVTMGLGLYSSLKGSGLLSLFGPTSQVVPEGLDAAMAANAASSAAELGVMAAAAAAAEEAAALAALEVAASM